MGYGLLIESGVSFHKTKLQGKKYFRNLITSLEGCRSSR